MTLEEARSSLEEGDLERARETLQRVIESDPNDSTALVDLGYLALGAGNEDEAAALFRQALEREPGNLDALRAIATIHGRSGREAEALDAVSAVAEAQPQDPLALVELADLALNVDRLDEASAAFQRLWSVDDDPEHEVYAFHGLIEVELRRERWRRALDLAVDATRVDRLGRTTDMLAFVVAQVFGEPDRPAPRAREVELALARSAGRAPPTAPGGRWLLRPQPRRSPAPTSSGRAVRPATPSSTTSASSATSGVCPECNHHFRLPVATRLEQLLDEGSFEDLSGDLEPLDALGFADSKPYAQRIEEAQRKTG